MSVTWVNVYEDGDIGPNHQRPLDAQWWAGWSLVRVERRINGHWLRPPVGMRGSEASHFRSWCGTGELVKR